LLIHTVRVTGVETWVSFVNVETKEQPMQWMHTHSPNKPKRFEQKLMATVFCDRKGVLIVEFVQQGTIMSEMYCETLKKLRRAIQNKGVECWHPVLLHDNVRPRTAARIRAFQLGVVSSPSLQPWSRSERLTPVYLPEELVQITAIQQ
jgi:hypothetical protein